MWIRVDEGGTLAGFTSILQEAVSDPGIQGLLILLADGNGFTPELLNPCLESLNIPIFGGIFPGLAYNQAKLERGSIVIGLAEAPLVRVIVQMRATTESYDDLIADLFPNASDARTCFVFVDGLTPRIDAFIEGLFNIFGLEMNYLGGGAGSLRLIEQPCLVTNAGLIGDAALIAMTTHASGVGVCHGWQSIAGPFRVTESEHNVITSLDFTSAFELYRQVVEAHSGQTCSLENFFELAKGYPFGISKLGMEKIVRDPIRATADGSLICVGEIPEGAYIHILCGNPKSLIQAAGNAMQLAEASFPPGVRPDWIFFIDCISRVLFLQGDFREELNAVGRVGLPIIGVLSLGEIANNKKDYLEFYNKTTVIGVMEAL
jgi:hypothetical protein